MRYVWWPELLSLCHLKLINAGWKEETSVFADGITWVKMVSL